MKEGFYDVGWNELLCYLDEIGELLVKKHSDIDTIIGISRGGLIPAALLARSLNVKKVFSFGLNFYNRENELKKVPDVYQPLPDSFWSSNILLVDDVADSGSSLNHVLTYINRRFCTDQPVLTYTVYFKPESRIKPTYFSKAIDQKLWINFPWEK